MSKTRDAILREAIRHFGPMNQRQKAIEELGELIVELARPLEREDRDAIAEEMADARIMLGQLEMLFENRDRVREIEWFKLTRLKERMNGNE